MPVQPRPRSRRGIPAGLLKRRGVEGGRDVDSGGRVTAGSGDSTERRNHHSDRSVAWARLEAARRLGGGLGRLCSEDRGGESPASSLRNGFDRRGRPAVAWRTELFQREDACASAASTDATCRVAIEGAGRLTGCSGLLRFDGDRDGQGARGSGRKWGRSARASAASPSCNDGCDGAGSLQQTGRGRES